MSKTESAPSKAISNPTIPPPITERLRALSVKLAEARGNERKLSKLAPALKSMAEEAMIYFSERDKAVSRLEPCGAARLAALEEEVTSLVSRPSKSDDQYLKLAVLERKLTDERAGAERELQDFSDSNNLLNQELSLLSGPLTNLLEAISPHRRALLAKITASLTPWYPGEWAGQVPRLAAGTPVYQASGKLYRTFFNPQRGPRENVRDLVAAISHALQEQE